ncbi:MAG: STAS domain-containing protein [Candidatus Omnitrophica bacterium]|nr:STAS domain-containing protein [Candidatus Omnitrophota bacterium]
MGHRLNGHSKVSINVVRCSGDLNAAQMVQIKPRFNRLMKQKRRFFLLDLKEACHADLAGLGILVDRIQKIRSLKGDLRLFNLRPEVSDILGMIGLNRVISSYATEEEARRSFQIA